eukprot:5454044-Amphidinium_carterae.1
MLLAFGSTKQTCTDKPASSSIICCISPPTWVGAQSSKRILGFSPRSAWISFKNLQMVVADDQRVGVCVTENLVGSCPIGSTSAVAPFTIICLDLVSSAYSSGHGGCNASITANSCRKKLVHPRY